ncbi:MarR family winged helix-turn-helix transcriptional regulator [Kitasatospora gansuensis]
MSSPRQPDQSPGPGAPGPRGAAFLLAQIGAHAAALFAERVAELGLTPADVGLLRMIAGRPGRSQRALATDLGVVPSRVVALIDNLETKGLVERRRSTEDRRNHELHLSPRAAHPHQGLPLGRHPRGHPARRPRPGPARPAHPAARTHRRPTGVDPGRAPRLPPVPEAVVATTKGPAIRPDP